MPAKPDTQSTVLCDPFSHLSSRNLLQLASKSQVTVHNISEQAADNGLLCFDLQLPLILWTRGSR